MQTEAEILALHLISNFTLSLKSREHDGQRHRFKHTEYVSSLRNSQAMPLHAKGHGAAGGHQTNVLQGGWK